MGIAGRGFPSLVVRIAGPAGGEGPAKEQSFDQSVALAKMKLHTTGLGDGYLGKNACVKESVELRPDFLEHGQ